jgi:hypothetical protein
VEQVFQVLLQSDAGMVGAERDAHAEMIAENVL